jgi:hypothetical protein
VGVSPFVGVGVGVKLSVGVGVGVSPSVGIVFSVGVGVGVFVCVLVGVAVLVGVCTTPSIHVEQSDLIFVLSFIDRIKLLILSCDLSCML